MVEDLEYTSFIDVQNVPCGTTGATCSKSVTLRVTNTDGSEESISLSQGAPLPDATNLKRYVTT